MKYIALFRGINVGGKNTVKMADLKHFLADMGCQNVQSYIQSGNVVFDASAGQNELIDKIQEGFARTFGFDSALILRTLEEWTAIITGLPFSEKELHEAAAAKPDVEHLYVYLAEDRLPTAAIEQLKAAYHGKDAFHIGKREIYLLCYDSIRDSKLAASLSKLGVPLTARNWKTIEKLHEMAVDWLK